MKKTLLVILAVSLMLLNFTVPAYAWSWKDDAKFEVAEYWVNVAEEGEIKIDGELDEEYLKGTKITSYSDEEPYKRNGYKAVWDGADGSFFAYIAIDVTGMYIYAEIEDTTIFETTNTNGNDGDCFQIYLDWCTPDIVHPDPEVLYDMYQFDGVGWNYGSYKSSYSVSGLQYIGWLSCDYNNNIAASGGFNPYNALGPEGTDSVLVETKLIDGGWACEWFIPWRDEGQKQAVLLPYLDACWCDKSYGYNSKYGYFYSHVGVGFQACDDSDIDNFVTPDREENVGIRFDQRKELGLSYWSDYSMLADVKWEGGVYTPHMPRLPEPEEVHTSDSAISITVALALSGTGIIVFAKKKKAKN